MRLRGEFLIVPVAILLAGILLGGGNIAAVLARTTGPNRVAGARGVNWTNWHGAGPGLPVALAGRVGLNAGGQGSGVKPTPPAVRPTDPADPYRVDTAPTITVERINAVLDQYQSPAAGLGQAFYDLGVQYGINPAVALAFFVHESACGTKGVARTTLSVGNIRTTPGYRDYQGYRAYDSWSQGIEDFYKLLRDLYIDGWGLHTVADILARYAPPVDNNDTGAYVADVQGLMDSWR